MLPCTRRTCCTNCTCCTCSTFCSYLHVLLLLLLRLLGPLRVLHMPSRGHALHTALPLKYFGFGPALFLDGAIYRAVALPLSTLDQSCVISFHGAHCHSIDFELAGGAGRALLRSVFHTHI